VSDDSVKIDSSHPDIGSKTIPVNKSSEDKTAQPSDSVPKPAPNTSKQAASDDFDFEPASNGEIVTPAPVAPVV